MNTELARDVSADMAPSPRRVPLRLVEPLGTDVPPASTCRARPPAGDTAARPSRPTAATFRRRRAVVVLAALALVFAAMVLFDRGGAEAGLEEPVDGHTVVEPGSTLWDVAVETAPDGVDPRAQLEDLRELNGLEGSEVAEWTVVLLPAR